MKIKVLKLYLSYHKVVSKVVILNLFQELIAENIQHFEILKKVQIDKLGAFKLLEQSHSYHNAGLMMFQFNYIFYERSPNER